MPPHVAGQLTVYQARMLCMSDEDVKGVVATGSESAVKARRDYVAKQYDGVIDNLMQGRRWDETDV